MKKKDPIETIQELYSQVNHKTKWISKAAEEVERTPRTLRVHWFAQFWSIPEEYQQTIIDLLKLELKQQKETA